MSTRRTNCGFKVTNQLVVAAFRFRYQRKPINTAPCLSNDIKVHPRYGRGGEKYGRDIKIYVYPTCSFKAPQTICKYAPLQSVGLYTDMYKRTSVRLSKCMRMEIGIPRYWQIQGIIQRFLR